MHALMIAKVVSSGDGKSHMMGRWLVHLDGVRAQGGDILIVGRRTHHLPRTLP